MKLKNLQILLWGRETSNKYQPLLREYIHTEILKTFKPKMIETDSYKFNKIFSSEWLDDELVVFGTKDKRLYLFNNKSRNIQLIEDYRNEKEKENFQDKINSHGIKSISYRDSKIAISVNKMIDVFSHNIYDLKKITSLKGSLGWISNTEWVNDKNLISSSRDGTIKVWDIDTNRSNNIYKYKNIRLDDISNQNFTRHFCYNKMKNNIYSVSPNGVMKYIDIVKQKQLYEYNIRNKECVVSTLVNDTYTVGSNTVVSFFDTRMNKLIMEIPNMNNNLGTRSLEWQDNNIISIGGGNNKLSFFDVRKNEFLKISDKNYYDIDVGWVDKSEDYYRIIDSYDSMMDTSAVYTSAIYTHKYSPLNNKIFVGGGPTSMGIIGSFITILE